MSTQTLVFGPCEVDPALREVRLHGLVREVAPKVFDLLIYLIEHRSRVVPKDELLERLWPAAVVSEGVLARAVMKARTAIGDDGKEAAYIRTVHRVGYRFAAELAPPPSVSPAGKPGSASRRIALLPIENRTGDAGLAWIDLGLMSLVYHALRPHRSVQLVPPADVLQVLETLGDEETLSARALSVERALATDCVVHGVLRREAAVYRLDYQSFGMHAEVLAGHFSADEPTRLGQQLAEVIESVFAGGEPGTVPLQLADPLARQALARALEKDQRSEVISAARLYEMAHELEPDQPHLLLLVTRAMARRDREKSVEMGRRLIDALDHRAEPWLHAAAEAALGHALALCKRFDEAQPHLDRALSLADGLEPSSEVVLVHRTCAITAERRGDDVLSLQRWETVERLSRELRDEPALEFSLNNTGMIHLRAGRLHEARVRIETALSLARRQGDVVALSHVLTSMADVHAAQGRLDLAVAHCDEMQQLLPRCAYAQPIAMAVFYGAQVYADARGISRIDRLLAHAAPLRQHDDKHVRALIAATDGLRAACTDDLTQSLDFFDAAIALIDDSLGQQQLHEFLPWQATAQLRHGRCDDARVTLQRIRSLEHFARQPGLQAVAARVEAGVEHASGDRGRARAMLAHAIETMVPGRHAALARLDAAWLALEDGELAVATQMLTALGAWLEANPLGLFVKARLLHAQGHHQAAIAAQQAGLGLLRDGLPPSWQLSAHQGYLQGRAGMDRLPRLPSFM